MFYFFIFLGQFVGLGSIPRTGLQLLFTSDPHDVAVRGTVNTLQAALQQVGKIWENGIR